MARLLSFAGFLILVASDLTQSFSSKLDFGEEDESTSTVSNSSRENEDVHVQHTIVVSTKLKNYNTRGFKNSHDDNTGPPMHRSAQFLNRKREDSGEVPVVNGNKALDTTQIHTPDTRLKTPINRVITPTRHNAPDEYDVYPNFVSNPAQLKPSNYYNNINWWSQDSLDTYRQFNNYNRRNDGSIYPNTRPGFHRSLTDEGVRDFYCKKCREMSGGQGLRGCIQQRSNSQHNQNTTPRIKIDGKLAKLN